MMGKPSLIRYRWAILALLLVVWMGVFIWMNPGLTHIGQAALQQVTPEPVQVQNPAPTLDPEWVANTSQTNGIILGAAILVLIIVGGTVATTRFRGK